MPRHPTAPSVRASASSLEPKPQKKPEREGSLLGDAVRALFKRQVREHRVHGQPAVDAEKAASQQAVGAGADAGPMRTELKALLDGAPQSRMLLRYLAAVEHGLKHKDPTGLFLFEVEPQRLRLALRQFDGLAPVKPSQGLAALRARIVDAMASREQKQKRRDMLPPRPDLMRDSRVEVAEARPSDFDRINEQWKAGSPAR